MKRFLVAFLVCTAMLLAQTQAQAASKITVIVASSVDTSEQNYMNVTYKKLVELAQKYSDNAFDFQLFPSMPLGDEQETVRALQLGTLQMLSLIHILTMPSSRPASSSIAFCSIWTSRKALTFAGSICSSGRASGSSPNARSAS